MIFSKDVIKKDISENPGIDIFCYISDRNGRKSTAIQLFMLEECLKGRPFILVRSKIDEKISLSWFSDYTLKYFEKHKIMVKFEKLDNYISKIMIEKDGKNYLYCYGLYLSVAEKYKSNYYKGFEKVTYLVWEECVPNKRQVQNIEYCRDHYFDELNRIFSIGSTVGRYNKLQYIFLGNDITDNIVNSITVGFDLLERIQVDKAVSDVCYINDKKYNFFFLYFSVEKGVNHWLQNLKRNINNISDVRNSQRLEYCLVTKYNRYYIYLHGKYIYISDKKTGNLKQKNQQEFFNSFGGGDLLKHYLLPTALLMLNLFYKCSYDEIAQYYGKKWDFNDNPKFMVKEENAPVNIFNLDEIEFMKMNELLDLPNYNNLLSLHQILKNNHVIYCNMGIKFKVEHVLLTLDIG